MTSHAGSLPRPEDLIALNERRADGDFTDEAEYRRKLREAVADVVARQRDTGIDLVNDGEFGHSMGERYDYGTWWTYVFPRLAGLELTELSIAGDTAGRGQARARSGSATFADRRDWQAFLDAYSGPGRRAPRCPTRRRSRPSAAGRSAYQGPGGRAAGHRGHEGRDGGRGRFRRVPELGRARQLRAGSATSTTPTMRRLMYACADAMREEYTAIIDAGLILQLDDPAIAENWDQINPAPSVEDYRRFTREPGRGAEPRDPRPAGRADPVPPVLGQLARPAHHRLPDGRPHRHHAGGQRGRVLVRGGQRRGTSHEWKLWRDVKLPEGKVILPGVVTHSTNVVEHPELVADRICRFAEAVGRENVIASTDCGLGGRVHPQIAWAKLDTLAKGAALATARLWG